MKMEDYEKILKGGIINENNVPVPHLNNDEGLINSGINLENDFTLNLNSFTANKSTNRIFCMNFEVNNENSLKKTETVVKRNEKLNINENPILSKSNFRKSILFFFETLISKNYTKTEKILYYLTHYITVHLFVIILTILKIFGQNYIFRECDINNVCACKDFQGRIYSILLNYFLWVNLLIITTFKISIQVLFERPFHRILSFLIFYVGCFLFGFIDFLSKENMHDVSLVSVFIALFPLIFQIKLIFDSNFKIIQLFKQIFILNIFSFLAFAHYIICSLGIPKINEYLREQYHGDIGRNLINFYQWFYFNIFFIIAEKLIKIYNRHILNFSFNDISSTIAIMRFANIFLVSVPIVSILDAEKFEDWSVYFLLISYGNFIFKFYTRVNLIFLSLKWIYYKLRKIKSTNINNNTKREDENDALCSKLLSGCLIDLVFIINSRLIILLITRKWFSKPRFETLYVNCDFDLSGQVRVNRLTATAIIIINSFITIGLFIYMTIKKTSVFEYQKQKNYLMNLYMIFMLHSEFENFLQLLLWEH